MSNRHYVYKSLSMILAAVLAAPAIAQTAQDQGAPVKAQNEPTEIIVTATNAAAKMGDIAAYRVDARYIMVDNGRLTTIGLRGLSAAETIADARAINQLDDQVVRAIYGDLGR